MLWWKKYKNTFSFAELDEMFPLIRDFFDSGWVNVLAEKKEIFAITFFDSPFTLNLFLEFTISWINPKDSEDIFFSKNHLTFDISLKSKKMISKEISLYIFNLKEELINCKDYQVAHSVLKKAWQFILEKVKQKEFNFLLDEQEIDKELLSFSKLFWINLLANDTNSFY